MKKFFEKTVLLMIIVIVCATAVYSADSKPAPQTANIGEKVYILQGGSVSYPEQGFTLDLWKVKSLCDTVNPNRPKDCEKDYAEIIITKEAISTISEKVTCYFSDNSKENECYSDKSGCRGYGSCASSVSGNNGIKITWKSSCGGYGYTTLDGVSEEIRFDCSTKINETLPPNSCIDSDGNNFYIKGYIWGTKNGLNFKHEDECTDSTTIKEHTCAGGQGFASWQNCQYGCSDGACKSINILPSAGSLADYEEFLFDSNRKFIGQIVVGELASTNHVIAAMDIAASLMRYSAIDSGGLPVGTTKLDRDAKTDRPSVIVGNRCSNRFAEQYTGSPANCTLGYVDGIGRIDYLVKNGQPAVMVSGYSDNDMRNAARVLANWRDYENLVVPGKSLCVKPASNTGTSFNVYACDPLSLTIPPVPPITTCVESDNGKDYVKKGIMTAGILRSEDRCHTSDLLIEYYCDANPNLNMYDTGFGRGLNEVAEIYGLSIIPTSIISTQATFSIGNEQLTLVPGQSSETSSGVLIKLDSIKLNDPAKGGVHSVNFQVRNKYYYVENHLCPNGCSNGACIPLPSSGLIIQTAGNYDVVLEMYDGAAVTKLWATVGGNTYELGTYKGADIYARKKVSLGYLQAGTEVVLHMLHSNWGAINPATNSGNNPGLYQITRSGDSFTIKADVEIPNGPYDDALFYVWPSKPYPAIPCIETDRGGDDHQRGTVTYNGVSKTDSCNGNIETEYYCGANGIASYSLSCPNGCRDGYCMPRNYEFGVITDWIDRDDPSGDGDTELKANFPDVCQNPLYVECWTIDGRAYNILNQKTSCTNDGFKCLNSENPNGCLDYKVKFYCPKVNVTITPNVPTITFSNAYYKKSNIPGADWFTVDIKNYGSQNVDLSSYYLYIKGNGEGTRSLESIGYVWTPYQTKTLRIQGSMSAPLFAPQHCTNGFTIGLLPMGIPYPTDNLTIQQKISLRCEEDSYCTDSDGGVNPFVKGNCKDARGYTNYDKSLRVDGSGPISDDETGAYVLEMFCLTPAMREYCKQFNSASYCDNLPNECYGIPLVPEENMAWSYFARNNNWICNYGAKNGVCLSAPTPPPIVTTADEGLRTGYESGSPPNSIYDGGQSSFSIDVSLDNVGGAPVGSNTGYVEIVGLDPSTYGTSNLKKNIATNIPAGGNANVEFNGLSYIPIIQGNLGQTIWSNICYKYSTKSTAYICASKDSTTSVCQVNGNKAVQNSGAPIKITNIEESFPGIGVIGISIRITHVGDGDAFFDKNADLCEDVVSNPARSKVYVEVNPINLGSQAITPICTGFIEGSSNKGTVRLYMDNNGVEQTTLYCTLDTNSLISPIETMINIDMTYKYLQHEEKTMTILHYENNTNSSGGGGGITGGVISSVSYEEADLTGRNKMEKHKVKMYVGERYNIGDYYLMLLGVDDNGVTVIMNKKGEYIPTPIIESVCAVGCKEVPEGCLCPRIYIIRTQDGYIVDSGSEESVSTPEIRVDRGIAVVKVIIDNEVVEIPASELSGTGLDIEVSSGTGTKNIKVSTDTANKKTRIKEGDATASTEYNLVGSDGKIYVETPNGRKLILVLPSEALERMQEKMNTDDVEIILETKGDTPSYTAESEKDYRILGIIPSKGKISASVDAQTGETDIDKPWYSAISTS